MLAQTGSFVQSLLWAGTVGTHPDCPQNKKGEDESIINALLMGSAVLAPCYSASLAFDSTSHSPQSFRITAQLVHSAGEKKQAYDVDNDLRAMCEEGQVKDAVTYFELVHKGGLKSTPGNYSFMLQECAKVKALAEGLKVHSLLIKSGLKVDVFLNNNLLSMYMKCGRSSEAWDVFDAMRGNRDVVTWTLMIDAYAQKGELKEALRLFDMMLQRRVRPNKITFVCMLKACNSPEAITNGKLIHHRIVKRCLETNIHVGCALVDMYLKCGSIADARKAFNKVPKPHDALWNVMINGYVQNGKNEDALKVFELMCRAKVEPSEKTLATAMKACSNHSALPHAMWLHSCIYQIKSEINDYLGHSLVEMYINCGSIEDAHNIFVRMPSKTEITWDSIIAGNVYVHA